MQPGQCVDPERRFPIPSENELRQKRRQSQSSINISQPTRTIKFTGDGREVTYATNLPFQPPGLNWRGNFAVTSSQLNQQREHRIGQHKNKGKQQIM